jgi:uncharacterized repeat protein (TIGR04138 family)
VRKSSGAPERLVREDVCADASLDGVDSAGWVGLPSIVLLLLSVSRAESHSKHTKAMKDAERYRLRAAFAALHATPERRGDAILSARGFLREANGVRSPWTTFATAPSSCAHSSLSMSTPPTPPPHPDDLPEPELEEPDWHAIIERAGPYPIEAFNFVREGLGHTVERAQALGQSGQPQLGAANGRGGAMSNPENRHVTGQQLCLGLRDFAIMRYGMLAPAVLRHWRITRTEDFGRIVYAMIDGSVMSKTPQDSEDDFAGVYEFDEAFSDAQLSQRIGSR